MYECVKNIPKTSPIVTPSCLNDFNCHNVLSSGSTSSRILSKTERLNVNSDFHPLSFQDLFRGDDLFYMVHLCPQFDLYSVALTIEAKYRL